MAREDIADLKALTDQYPWFSGAHLLSAIGARMSGDVLADETLKVSAAHVPSRAVLFDLQDISLEQAALQLKPAAARENDPLATDLLPKTVENSGTAAESAMTDREKNYPAVKPEHAGSENLKETQAVVDPVADVAEAITSDHTGTGPTTDPTPDPPISLRSEAEKGSPDRSEEQGSKTSEEDPIQNELDREILRSALANAYDLTWQEKVKAPIEPSRQPVVRYAERFGAHADRSSNLPIEPVLTEAQDRVPPTASEVVVTPRSKLKFTDWLVSGNDVSPNDPVVQGEQYRSVDISTGTTIGKSEPLKEQLPPSALIDRFIQLETPAPVRKAEFFTPQQAAKKSLDDTAGLVSETLAKIYERQGNFQKAIDAYAKLALKYPEKSAYFAALSKILEERSNS